MPIGTAVHDRTFALAESLNYREWSGYYAVSAYEAHHEHEYNAIRNAAALIDVSPLFKYILRGRDAQKLVDRVITRDAMKLAIGQVYYTPWCDEHGKVIDDGTVTRLDETEFRWTAADPSLRWFTQNAIGLDVTIEDVSEQIAALALQGPNINMGMTITDPTSFYNLLNGIEDPVPNTPAGHELAYIRKIAELTDKYAVRIKEAAGLVTQQTAYPDNDLAAQLKIVARLIGGGLKTRIYMVGMDQFDTHSNQTEASDTTTGNHANLLSELSSAVKAFMDDCKYLAIEERVIGMTFSEFGRRIKKRRIPSFTDR